MVCFARSFVYFCDWVGGWVYVFQEASSTFAIGWLGGFIFLKKDGSRMLIRFVKCEYGVNAQLLAVVLEQWPSEQFRCGHLSSFSLSAVDNMN